ncbi:putative disease resistance protein At5g05400 [Populus alba]|uniref:putative disease resistance protein At5g05400 n=1 Tax=Populus alba TaxID=43335 RepID=UPI003CC79429
MTFESVVDIISKIAEPMVKPVGRQLRYMFCFNHFVEEFNERKQNLDSAKERLQDDVKAAERNAEEIYKDVKKWLEDANNEIEGAKSLENEIGKNGKCFTWCPNCMRQFKLSKALAKKSETFRKLLEKKITEVADKAPPQPIEFLPSKEFTPSEASKEALEQIMKALNDDNVNMIGLYGMGGVGKTTLVKEVGRRAKELQPPLDEVLMATVSQNPNVIDIQDRMAEKLVLEFKEKSKEGRADRLWKRLQGKKMLIILDDVWKHIELKEIGIPFGDDHRGCKILLTTRRRDMFSYNGVPEKLINAGLDDGDSTLNTVARKVASECHCLPIALVTVGKALRDKSEVEWKRSKETKLCFLLCCLFPEDYNIPIEDLTRYAVGYGLHQDGSPLKMQGNKFMWQSKTSKLVLIQIASSEEYGFMVKAVNGLKEWPFHDKSFEGMREIEVLSLKGGCLSLQSLELSTKTSKSLVLILWRAQGVKVVGCDRLSKAKKDSCEFDWKVEEVRRLLIDSFQGWVFVGM